jgi:hypothetical protein
VLRASACVRDEAIGGCDPPGSEPGAGDGCTPSEMMGLRVFSSRTIADGLGAGTWHSRPGPCLPLLLSTDFGAQTEEFGAFCDPNQERPSLPPIL